jgi:putative flippase GtrA
MPELIQLIKFAMVGVVVTLVDFISFWILLNVFEKLKIKNVFKFRITTVSNIIGFLIANSTSFLLNSFFTFSDSKINRGIIPYLLVSLFSLSISTFLVQTFTSEINYTKLNAKIFQNRLTQKQFALFIKLITVLVTMVTNYVGYKYLVY